MNPTFLSIVLPGKDEEEATLQDNPTAIIAISPPKNVFIVGVMDTLLTSVMPSMGIPLVILDILDGHASTLKMVPLLPLMSTMLRRRRTHHTPQ